MKWSWGWKGAAIALVLWVAYLLSMWGLGAVIDDPYTRTPRAAAAIHGAAKPGEVLVTAVWAHVGSWLDPDAFPTDPDAKQSALLLFPEFGYEQVLDEGLSHQSPNGSLIVTRSAMVAFYLPTPLELLSHFLLLPGMALAATGFVAGLLLAVGAALVAGTDRSSGT